MSSPILDRIEYSAKGTGHGRDGCLALFRLTAPKSIQAIGGEQLQNRVNNLSLLGLGQVSQQNAKSLGIRRWRENKRGHELLDQAV
jgi:hypothetical protein